MARFFRRPQWYTLYFVLAGFDLFTVSLSLYLNHRLMGIHIESVHINQEWAHRLEQYADISRLAAEVNAPGNDVFDSQDADSEEMRFHTALAAFQQTFGTAQQEVRRTVLPAHAAQLLQDFAHIQSAMDAMVEEAQRIFTYVRERAMTEAGGRMATMDRKYAHLHTELAQLNRHVREILQAHFAAQRATADVLRRSEYVLAACVGVMITAVTLYGHKIAQAMRAAAQEREHALFVLGRTRDALEQRVAERTSELVQTNALLSQEIHERLRAEEAVHALNAELEQRVDERTAQLEASNKELEAFCYSVSHDLRAPLRAIDGFSQALLEESHAQLDAQGQRYLTRVRAASQQMGALIDALLTLSRLTRQELRSTTVDLSAYAQSIAEELQTTAPQRQVAWHIAPDIMASGDPRLLRIVLVNLLENAWKYTSKCAHACITFDTFLQEDQVVYRVRDNGAGFDMAYVNKLFGAFQRLHRTEDFAGLGIGLATVARIVQRHGGRVWADGAVEQGATFAFTLAMTP